MVEEKGAAPGVVGRKCEDCIKADTRKSVISADGQPCVFCRLYGEYVAYFDHCAGFRGASE